jgi:septum formation protein
VLRLRPDPERARLEGGNELAAERHLGLVARAPRVARAQTELGLVDVVDDQIRTCAAEALGQPAGPARRDPVRGDATELVRDVERVLRVALRARGLRASEHGAEPPRAPARQRGARGVERGASAAEVPAPAEQVAFEEPRASHPDAVGMRRRELAREHDGVGRPGAGRSAGAEPERIVGEHRLAADRVLERRSWPVGRRAHRGRTFRRARHGGARGEAEETADPPDPAPHTPRAAYHAGHGAATLTPLAADPTMRRVLVLASASPRRHQLLAWLGIPFTIDSADVDETPHPDENAAEMVARLAREKAMAGRGATPGRVGPRCGHDRRGRRRLLGKPADDDEAAAMLVRLAGREHRVSTGFALVAPGGTARVVDVVRTRVVFRPLDERAIRAYVASGEPDGKAGGYAIQGLGAGLIERIDGSFTNVMGLPVTEVARALAEAGFRAG